MSQPTRRTCGTMSEVTCPKCESDNVRVRVNSNNVGFVECGDCFTVTNSKYGAVQLV